MTHVLKYGGGGPDVSGMALENFSGTAFNSLSFCCTPIELLSNDGKDSVISTATGFFWRHSGVSFLISNWHVLCGRNVFTGEPCSPSGYIPRRVKFYGCSFRQKGPYLEFLRTGIIIELQDELVEKISSLGMSDLQFDVCALPIPDGSVFGAEEGRDGFKGAPSASCFLNENNSGRVITHVADDCFILGYPFRNYDGLMPPVWKRGSIASEPMIGVDGRPLFLVDAATSSGMSGAPILRRVNIGWSSSEAGDREMEKYSFIGVYGGRLLHGGSELHGAGYGWYATLVNKAIEGYFPNLVAANEFQRDG